MGFRLGNYAGGSVHVSSPEEISFVPESMKKVVKVGMSSPNVKNHLSCLYHMQIFRVRTDLEKSLILSLVLENSWNLKTVPFVLELSWSFVKSSLKI